MSPRPSKWMGSGLRSLFEYERRSRPQTSIWNPALPLFVCWPPASNASNRKMKSLPRFFGLVSLSLAVFPTQYLGAAETHSKILLIGDSHVEGTYGEELDRRFRALPSSQIATYGVGGSTPRWYLEGVLSPWGFFSRNEEGETRRAQNQLTPLIDDLLSTHSPSLVVISLGTNLLWSEESPQLKDSARIITQKIKDSGASCAWIGPPGLGPQYRNSIQKITNLLSLVLAPLPCRWINGQALIEYPTDAGGDGIHYDTAGSEGVARGKVWAQRAFEAVVNPVEKRAE